jgi:thymidylate synthase ThyX
MIQAQIIADSVNPKGKRLTSFVLQFPRIILAELNTHRMFSRNSASSRAVPFAKMLKRVQDDPFIPIQWMKDHSGMQGAEYFTPEEEYKFGLKEMFLDARDYAIEKAERLSKVGVTKQICNRLLEPFMWHTAIVTATDYENFFALRAHEAAEIHLQSLAHCMLIAYNESEPKELKNGDFHIPFGDKIDEDTLCNLFDVFTGRDIERIKVKIATARCARVSYINYDGKDDYEADLKLHDQLAKMGHWSAFEHCAIAGDHQEYIGNFCGFLQYRKHFNEENRKDSRVVKP